MSWQSYQFNVTPSLAAFFLLTTNVEMMQFNSNALLPAGVCKGGTLLCSPLIIDCVCEPIQTCFLFTTPSIFCKLICQPQKQRIPIKFNTGEFIACAEFVSQPGLTVHYIPWSWLSENQCRFRPWRKFVCQHNRHRLCWDVFSRRTHYVGFWDIAILLALYLGEHFCSWSIPGTSIKTNKTSVWRNLLQSLHWI